MIVPIPGMSAKRARENVWIVLATMTAQVSHLYATPTPIPALDVLMTTNAPFQLLTVTPKLEDAWLVSQAVSALVLRPIVTLLPTPALVVAIILSVLVQLLTVTLQQVHV